MKLNKDTKILIIGLGVIGGGYAAALTNAGYAVKCITKNRKDIDYARERGMMLYGTTEIDEDLISESELIIFALYPSAFIKWIEEHQGLFAPGTLITDVSGVKGSVVKRVQSVLRDDVEFIAAHPMAGRERSGVEFSSPDVFRGANFIVTPTKKNTPEAINTVKQLAKILGFARISELSCREHDKMIAFLSQLTHVIAVSLMNANTSPNLEKYTGDSFRDLTRIAKINEQMWCELFLLNKDALLAEIDSFSKELASFRDALANGESDVLKEKMKKSTKRRLLFDKPKA